MRQSGDGLDGARRYRRQADEGQALDQRFGAAHRACRLERLDVRAGGRDRREQRIENVPRASERHRAQFFRDTRRRVRQSRRRRRPAFGDRQFEIRQRDDAVTDEDLLLRLVDETQFLQAAQQKRQGDQALTGEPERLL